MSENWSWQLANQLSCEYWKGVMERWSQLRPVEAVGSSRAVGPRCCATIAKLFSSAWAERPRRYEVLGMKR